MIVNGKQVNLAGIQGSNLSELIRHFELEPGSVAVEMNGEIPPRESWDGIVLSESDRIELIRFVGGG